MTNVYVGGRASPPTLGVPTPPVPPFSLTDVPGLLAWFKADALVLNDGDPVATWPDSSGFNRHASQATAASRPTFRAGVVNGLPVVRGDGVDDRLQTAVFGDVVQPTTVFVVWANQDNVRATIILFSGIANLKRQQQSINSAGSIHGIFAGASLSGGTVPALGTFMVTTLIFNGATTQLWENGVSEIGPANGGAQPLDGLTIGDADPTVVSLPFKGDMAELALYAGALSAADRARVEGYLRAKYGTP